jgi:site-specific recombinase XerD
VATFCVTGIREAEAVGLDIGSLSGEPGARRLEVVGKGGKARPIPIDPVLDEVLSGYQKERAARFPKHDLDHPGTPLFVDVRGRRLSVDQVRYLVDRLYVRAGIRAQVPSGALVHALRHTFATAALEAGADVVELQELLGHASLETTRRYLSATGQGLRHVIQAHPGQAALRATWQGRT